MTKRTPAAWRSLLTLVLLTTLSPHLFAATDARLASLYEKKDCFALRDALQRRATKDPDTLFFKAVSSNNFNRPQRSLGYLRQYLKLRGISSERKRDSYTLLADNYLKLFQYRRAAIVLSQILARENGQLDAEQREDYENSKNLWWALRHVPPQTASFRGDSVLQGTLKAIPFTVNGRRLSFPMDSGASLSIITRSLATQLGLRFAGSSIKVGSITGEHVQAELAVARKLQIENVTLSNVVFLVFADKDLLGPSKGEVKGVLGYPVFLALKQIRFERGGTVVIPAQANTRGDQNLCLDGSKPLLAAEYEGRRLVFALDSGAGHSILYPSFYKDYQHEITSRYQQQSETINGVGGSTQIPAFRIQDFILTISEKRASLPEVAVLVRETLPESKYFYGNLGNDVIRQFGSMTINFVAMSVVFE